MVSKEEKIKYIRDNVDKYKSVHHFLKENKNFHSFYYKYKKEIGDFKNIYEIHKIKCKEEKIKYIKDNIHKYKSISHFLEKNRKFHHFYYKHKEEIGDYKNIFGTRRSSTQQLICKKILESILNDNCLYNTRKILENKIELDLYSEKYKIALEYNGYYWHFKSQEKDLEKSKICEEKGILFLLIKENYMNELDNIEKSTVEIKNQFKKYLNKINQFTNLNITDKQIDEIVIDDKDLLYETYSEKDINYILNECCRYSEIKTKYNKIWQFILRNKKLHLLEPVKKRDYIHMNKKDFINHVLTKYKNYTSFLNHKIYQLARKRKYITAIRYCFDNNVLYSEELDLVEHG